jgi:translation initiation factor 2B subunit (eIF-2B alpha/beta/delta family)
MSEETLFTAARRISRFIRVDDERHGGLLSQDTIQANETLIREIDREEKRLKAEAAEKANEPLGS